MPTARLIPADLAFRAAADDNLSRLLLEAHQHLLHTRFATSAAMAKERLASELAAEVANTTLLTSTEIALADDSEWVTPANPVKSVEAKERQAIETLVAAHNAEFVTRLLADLTATQVPA